MSNKIIEILESEIISATIAHALVDFPVIFSPTIKSEVFPVGPVNDEKVSVGADASDVLTDSKTPSTFIKSATFRDISKS